VFDARLAAVASTIASCTSVSARRCLTVRLGSVLIAARIAAEAAAAGSAVLVVFPVVGAQFGGR
jgi:hypothetical protein